MDCSKDLKQLLTKGQSSLSLYLSIFHLLKSPRKKKKKTVLVVIGSPCHKHGKMNTFKSKWKFLYSRNVPSLPFRFSLKVVPLPQSTPDLTEVHMEIDGSNLWKHVSGKQTQYTTGFPEGNFVLNMINMLAHPVPPLTGKFPRILDSKGDLANNLQENQPEPLQETLAVLGQTGLGICLKGALIRRKTKTPKWQPKTRRANRKSRGPHHVRVGFNLNIFATLLYTL